MRKNIAIFAAVMLLASLINSIPARSQGGKTPPIGSKYSDPCFNSFTQKTSVAINISSAVSTKLISNVAGQVIYPCSVTIGVGGSATATALFEFGTQTTNPCDTGTAVATGAMLGNTVPVVYGSWNSTSTFSPAGATLVAKDFCLVAGGTTPSIQGWMTYVIQ